MPAFRRLAIVFAAVAAAAALAVPAGAQTPEHPPAARHPPPPPPPAQGPGSFFFPFFHGSPAPNDSFMRPPAPIESTKAPPPRKQETPPTKTIVVIGDSLADWLAYGLEETYADAPEIGVVRKIRPTSGLIHYEQRSDTPEWSQAVKEMLAPEKPRAIVVMLGLNDRLPFHARAGAQPSPQGQDSKPAAQSAADAAQQEGEQPAGATTEAQRSAQGGTYEFNTDKWDELYSKRVDDMIAVLKSKGVPVLWVGLPAIRGTRSTSDMSDLNDIYRARAERAGITYVDIWDGFVDDQGRYTVQGPDFEGQIRRLRTADGVHFTKAGAIKLAHYVQHELGRILSTKITPVALPIPAGPSSAKPNLGGPLPGIGPVLPLMSSSGGGNSLLGDGKGSAPETSDPIAARVLGRGDPLAAPAGRADDFAWPRPGAADADGTSDATPAPLPH